MDTTARQRALVALGYSVSVDGVIGPKTKEAIKDFQQRHGCGLAAQLYWRPTCRPRLIDRFTTARQRAPDLGPWGFDQAVAQVG